MDTQHIRTLIKDRQVKAGGYGTWSYDLCLVPDLVISYQDLVNERTLAKQAKDRDTDRMSDAGEIETPELDAQIDEAKTAVEEASVTLKFKSLGDQKFNELQSRHPERESREQIYAFYDEVLGLCFMHVEANGDQTDVTWDEIAPSLDYGQMNYLRQQVLALNERRVDVPFSLRSSKSGQKTSAN